MKASDLCLATLALLLLLAVPDARACGPDFPPYLFASREATLATLLDGNFALEAGRLAPAPDDKFEPVEDREDPPDARTGGEKETALYRAGAGAFRRGDHAAAAAQLRALLELPQPERGRLAPLAAYTLGRIESSPARYQQVRELVRSGAPDPLGLAVSSYGQEAKLALDAGDDVTAVGLYARQASFGSSSGALSLLFVARAIAGDERRLTAALADPTCQRLLATYAWTRDLEIASAESAQEGRGPRLLERLAAIPDLAGADRLAAAAWRAGRFELAERFAGKAPSALDAWVRAKLALRRGDRAAAEALLAQAAAGHGPFEEWGSAYGQTVRPRHHLEIERAILALVRDDFLQAMERALASCAWQESAYLGERVLTIEELTEVVERGATRGSCDGPRGETEALGEDEEEVPSWREADWGPGRFDAKLRLLLARRLLRAGREDEALRYFRGTALEEQAKAWIGFARAAGAAEEPVAQAQALFAQARLTRGQGLELLGTEMAPDWAWAGGMFDLGDYYSWEREAAMDGEAGDGGLAADPSLLGSAERERTTRHAPRRPERFHYRRLAADLAEQAAGLVPERSQAYAALLCQAAVWAPERASQLWRQYVERGALLVGDMVFGQRCPEPDFERARHPRQSKQQPLWKRYRKSQLVLPGLGLLAPCLVGVGLLARRRGRERS